MLSYLLREIFIVEYAVIDSIGRNKGWHYFKPLNSLDDLPKTKKDIKALVGDQEFKVKVWKHSTLLGSEQIA